MSETFLAWCAGFFDGEGTVVIARHMDKRTKNPRERYYLGAMLYQTDREPLDEIRAAFGGSICKLKTRVYSLHLTGSSGDTFLRAIRPHCRVKGPEIDIALEFRSTFTNKHNERVPDAVMSRRLELRNNLIQFRRDKYARAKEERIEAAL